MSKPNETKEERLAAIKTIVAKAAFKRAMVAAGFTLGESGAERLFEGMPSINESIDVYSDDEIYGVDRAVKNIIQQFPECFPPQGGTGRHTSSAGGNDPTTPGSLAAARAAARASLSQPAKPRPQDPHVVAHLKSLRGRSNRM